MATMEVYAHLQLRLHKSDFETGVNYKHSSEIDNYLYIFPSRIIVKSIGNVVRQTHRQISHKLCPLE